MTAYTSSTIDLSTMFALSRAGETKSVIVAGFADRTSVDLSGFIINQNAPRLSSLTNEPSYDENVFLTTQNIAQEFYLPKDFTRTGKIPRITGLHLNLHTSTVAVDIIYSLQVYDESFGWKQIFKGLATSADVGAQWLKINFKPFEIDSNYLENKFRLVLGYASGVDGTYYSTVSPFKNSGCLLYNTVDQTTITVDSKEVAIRFNLMGDVADDGLDVLGNPYRSLAYTQPATNVVDINSDTWWMSKANPSKYGVENLYFDLTESTTVSAVYLDPVTPNLNFSVYYYNGDEVPGESVDSWDNLLWQRVPKDFILTKKQNYLFPYSIIAKYIKIEFTQLQAQPYLTGDFQKPILYKKHPQWVLDYFLSQYAALRGQTYDPFIANSVNVSYDLLDLAYSYYKNDIVQVSTDPEDIKVVDGLLTDLSQVVRNLLVKNEDGVDSLDDETYMRVKTNFKPYLSHPTLHGDFDSSNAALSLVNLDTTNYPLEDMPIVSGTTSVVSNHKREQLITEKSLSNIHFFLECRHSYREAIAKLPNGKAYFAGIRDVAFQKNDNRVTRDGNMYTTIAGDLINSEINDFTFTDSTWISR